MRRSPARRERLAPAAAQDYTGQVSGWCGRLKRRALWVLTCVLLAVAVAPAASGEGVVPRPAAALVLRLSVGAARARAHVSSSPRRLGAPVALASRADWRERVASPRERSRARVEPDERYLYLSNSTFLC